MKKEKIAILGAGLVGSEIALDLAKRHSVCAFDANLSNLQKLKGKVDIKQTNCLDKETLRQELRGVNFVVNALPGAIGFCVLDYLIDLEKNVIDISFFPESALDLDEKAKAKGVTAVVDIGVAPGLSNMLVGRFVKTMQDPKSVTIYVGGLPQTRSLPWEYQVVFSASDVLEEYTRPARIRRNGRDIQLPALSEPEFLEIERIGTVEAFLTDGLRSLLISYPQIETLVEKTIRYPGHRHLAWVLRESGFLSKEKKQVGDMQIAPFDMAVKVLTEHWKDKGEDLTILIVKVNDQNNHCKEAFMLDFYDKENNVTSMARTTGYTACAAAELLLSGKISSKGIITPEKLGEDSDVFNATLNFLKLRNIEVTLNES